MNDDHKDCAFVVIVVLLMAGFACWLIYEFLTQAWQLNLYMMR